MSIKILIVDDEPIARNIIVEVLYGKGYALIQAGSESEASNILLSQEIDLVISDIVMPDGTGFDLLKKAKFINPNIRFILVTGQHNIENIPLCLKYNVSRYIVKGSGIENEIAIAVENTIKELDTEIIMGVEKLDHWLSFEIKSTVDSLTRSYSYIKRYLMDFMPAEVAIKTSTAFYELLINAVEWGSRFEKDLTVHVDCIILSNQALFKIRDSGPGFDLKNVPQVSDPIELQTKRKEAGKRVGGYGIHISKKLMDDIQWNERGNCLVMIKKF